MSKQPESSTVALKTALFMEIISCDIVVIESAVAQNDNIATSINDIDVVDQTRVFECASKENSIASNDHFMVKMLTTCLLIKRKVLTSYHLRQMKLKKRKIGRKSLMLTEKGEDMDVLLFGEMVTSWLVRNNLPL